MAEMPEGFKCVCDTWHPFGAYVAAHWGERLTHTCSDCGRQHTVLKGVATPIKTGSKPRAKRKV